MADTFKILLDFLERHGPEVEGRELSEPTGETRGKLRELASGKLPEREQSELFELLNRNPQWLAWLAREVISLRAETT